MEYRASSPAAPAVETETAEPPPAELSLYRPETARPDPAEPDLAEPDLAEPDLAEPDLAEPDLAEPDLAEPDLAEPDLAEPDLAEPEAAEPEAAEPEAAEPEAAEPARSGPDHAGTPLPVRLPIPNYDDLTVASIRARLRNLNAAQVLVLLGYEETNAARPAVLTMYERRITKLRSGQG